jgi:hypothetical protein
MRTTVRLVPDLGDELVAALQNAETLLAEVVAWEEADADTEWPRPLGGQVALAGVRRIFAAVAPTQGGLAARLGYTGRVLSPGEHEHRALRLADVDPADVAAVAGAAEIFGDSLPGSLAHAVLENGAQLAFGAYGEEACARLVRDVARVAALLDLAADRDTAVLTECVDGNPSEDIWLYGPAEAAYQRYARRLNAVWSGSDPLELQLY